MSRTYRAAIDDLVHSITYVDDSMVEGEIHVDAWCGAAFTIDVDRYEGGVRERNVVTCVTCLNNEFKRWRSPETISRIIEANSVKDMRKQTDAQFLKVAMSKST